jgi:hypothetical protein
MFYYFMVSKQYGTPYHHSRHACTKAPYCWLHTHILKNIPIINFVTVCSG